MEQSYRGISPMIRYLGDKIGPGNTFLDAGSGEGAISLMMAQDLQSGRIILVDKINGPEVSLPPNAEFHRSDIESEGFVRRFQNMANIVICLNVLHELENPVCAAINLIRILPIGGASLILDYTEQGGDRQSHIAIQGDVRCLLHHQRDLVTTRQFGLNSNHGIRRFWDHGIFPRVPGECLLSFSGDLYSVLYIPHQWGEVKEPPPEIKRLMRTSL